MQLTETEKKMRVYIIRALDSQHDSMMEALRDRDMNRLATYARMYRHLKRVLDTIQDGSIETVRANHDYHEFTILVFDLIQQVVTNPIKTKTVKV